MHRVSPPPAHGYVLVIAGGYRRVSFGFFQEQHLHSTWQLELNTSRTADEYGMFLYNVLDNTGITMVSIEAVVLACVNPQHQAALVSMAERFFNLQPMLVNRRVRTRLQLGDGRAGDLSPLRLANLVALNSGFKLPAVVLHMGTLISLDVLDTGAVYRGGLLLPGLGSSMGMMPALATDMPLVPTAAPEKFMARSLQSAVQSGCYWAAVEGIRGLLRRVDTTFGFKGTTVVATGHDMPQVQNAGLPLSSCDIDLTLKGLQLIYELNQNEMNEKRSTRQAA